MNKVIEFYCNNGVGPRGASVEDMLAFSDDMLEGSHDVIQWMFPLHEPSNFNYKAPLIAKEAAVILQECPIARERMSLMADRFARFLGFEKTENGYGNFDATSENAKNWCSPYNHNHLRITRAIRSLRLFGLDDVAKQLFDACNLGKEVNYTTDKVLRFWTMALEDDIFETLRK